MRRRLFPYHLANNFRRPVSRFRYTLGERSAKIKFLPAVDRAAVALSSSPLQGGSGPFGSDSPVNINQSHDAGRVKEECEEP